MELDYSRREILVGIAAFLLSLAAGLTASTLADTGGGNLYSSNFNLTADSENDIRTVNFDNQSINILFEDSEKARIYLDYDQDGSSDRELNISGSNSTQIFSRYVTLDRKSYEFRFQYRDNPDKQEDAFIRLIRIERVQ